MEGRVTRARLTGSNGGATALHGGALAIFGYGKAR
jgi:hypothetical protein